LNNSQGRVTARTFTDSVGDHQFTVGREGAFVVREVVPRGYVQTLPTFSSEEPQGCYAPGFGSKSWNYGTDTDPSAGPLGPAGWATIAPAGNEPFESPINITTPARDLSGALSINFNDGTTKQILNNGHQIQVQFPATTGDTISVGVQTFALSQFHFHDPAETTLHGRHDVLEEHFVTSSESGAEAVVAVFFKVGAHNDVLQPILDAARAHATASGSSTTLDAPIDLAGLLPSSLKGWYYQGSLTTPPLSQPVSWFVLQQPITLDANQLLEYQQIAAAGGFLPNARPTRPLDGRVFNQISNNVNFQGQSLTGVEFAVTRLA
jgi:carbonic anhydrase